MGYVIELRERLKAGESSLLEKKMFEWFETTDLLCVGIFNFPPSYMLEHPDFLKIYEEDLLNQIQYVMVQLQSTLPSNYPEGAKISIEPPKVKVGETDAIKDLTDQIVASMRQKEDWIGSEEASVASLSFSWWQRFKSYLIKKLS